MNSTFHTIKTQLQKKDPRAHLKIDRFKSCPQCLRSREECFCGKVLSFENHLRVIILQHPQEQYKQLNSAKLASMALSNSKLLVGLSWPNFKYVAGPDEQPSNWGILYLKGSAETSKPCQVFARNKREMDNPSVLRGIIALDGSWKQAKTLWWRNPWFLKLNRISLNPQHHSLRAQTKREGLSTIEAIALAFKCLGEKEKITASLIEQYEKLILNRGKEL
ncbi:MAG: DTW domain-containing protein [Fibrobacter sp.]|jgi:DTW domain-containing protein YfiP|nr:DTW domain-containing protein [Fibrobacter sp.]